jgi:nitrogen fixation NifU-like protein
LQRCDTPGEMHVEVILNAMYSAKLLDHFENPRNTGELASPTSRVTVENPACGDVMSLDLLVENGTIRDVRFKAKGCVPAMACASAITSLIREKPVTEARAISKEDLRRAVDDVPPASRHALDLAIDAVRSALSKIK